MNLTLYVVRLANIPPSTTNGRINLLGPTSLAQIMIPSTTYGRINLLGPPSLSDMISLRSLNVRIKYLEMAHPPPC